MGKSSKFTGAAAAMALHAIAIALLLQFQPVRSAITNAAPLMVSLLSPPKVIAKPQERPKPLPVKPKVRRPQPVEPPPVLTAAAEAPAPYVAPPPPPAPTPAELAAPPTLAAAQAPPPVIPPNFNADYLHNPAPVYPPLARRMGQQGKVVLRVLVNAGGAAEKVEIRSGSGSNLLDTAALDAVKR
jgi:protein TonB